MLSRLTETHGTIVVVGDGHQSIYRFRGTGVANLLQFARRFPDAAWWRTPPTAFLIGISYRL